MESFRRRRVDPTTACAGFPAQCLAFSVSEAITWCAFLAPGRNLLSVCFEVVTAVSTYWAVPGRSVEPVTIDEWPVARSGALTAALALGAGAERATDLRITEITLACPAGRLACPASRLRAPEDRTSRPVGTWPPKKNKSSRRPGSPRRPGSLPSPGSLQRPKKTDLCLGPFSGGVKHSNTTGYLYGKYLYIIYLGRCQEVVCVDIAAARCG